MLSLNEIHPQIYIMLMIIDLNNKDVHKLQEDLEKQND